MEFSSSTTCDRFLLELRLLLLLLFQVKTSMVDINSTGKVSFEIKLEYCPNCGEKDYTNSPFCPTCGFEKKSKSVL